MSDILTMIDAQRAIYLKSFLTVFSISIVVLTVTYYQSKNLFPMLLSISLFLNLGVFIYLNQKYKAFVKQKLIPSLEKKLNAKYYDDGYLTLDKINSLNIFAHKANYLKSNGYFKNDKKIIEFLKISFIKKDTEENDIENTLFDGKVIIEDGNKITIKSNHPEYFEAGENIKTPKPSPDEKKYTFIDGEKLFQNFNIFLKVK